ncbi:MAG TPA: hypothetical protein VGX28_05460 [Frankiaceae bacterium]|jgi:hypothetical protein|nr:hypothetical protein [Frankiaceae bacterium]
MRRLAATAALAAVTALALPAVPASACSLPTGWFQADADPLTAGSPVRLTGSVVADANGSVGTCHMPPPTTPEPSGTPIPDETAAPAETASPETIAPSESAEASATPTPSETVATRTLPPLLPVANPLPQPAKVTIRSWPEELGPTGPERAIGWISPDPVKPYGDPKDELHEFSFSAVVTIPADVRPGRYQLSVFQPGIVSWGFIGVDVVAGLPRTGTDTDVLVRLATLSLLSGAGALAAARRARRV